MDRQRILIIILVLLFVGGAYYYYQVYQPAPVEGEVNPAIADLDTRLAELRPLANVEFNTSVLDNPFFRSLKTVVVTVPPAVSGRSNPFLPF